MLTFEPFFSVVTQLADVILTWGWLLLVFLAMWIAWETYVLLKHIDYVGSIQWTFFQVTLPDEVTLSPKAFENAIEVWGGMHKDPDFIERLFEGYFLAWYSCELQCTKGRARYIIVVPTPHAKFIEGVIYGQYPMATVTEVEDYTQEFSYENIGKTFDMWGSEVHLVKDDIYPIRTYREFEDALAEDETYIDPHQAMIEAFTNINEGEHFWVQVLIKPIDAGDIDAWTQRGLDKISELAGADTEKKPGFFASIGAVIFALPQELYQVLLTGPLEPESEKQDLKFHIYNPTEDAEMKGILQKVQRTGFKTMIRIMHMAPVGKLHKPNYGKAIGAFKQFNSFHLNSFKPDSATKTNGPNYILKHLRRAYRMRAMLLNYQWRDFWGDRAGYMLNAEELATLYHFPNKYTRSPAIQRAPAIGGSPPSNVPYV
jgi:hypothetical protein